MGILGLVWAGSAGRALLWLHWMRKLSDVTGTVVARDRQFTGRSYWTYPVAEFTTRDGIEIRRTFRQIARPAIGASWRSSMTRARCVTVRYWLAGSSTHDRRIAAIL
jgi:hypothetical protein